MRLRHLAPFAAPLAIAAALYLAAPQLRAQTPAPAPQVEPAAPHAPAAAPSEGHAQEEEHAAAPVKLFGIELSNVGKFGVQVVNFAIFFVILYVILKGALSSAFKARAKELEEQLDQAGKDKEEGEAQLLALEARMADMQSELSAIMARSQADAEAEKARILEAAKAEAAQILAQTRAEIEFQKRLAEKELRALVAELAIEGATQRLAAQVQGSVAARVLDRAIQEVGGAK